MKPWILTSTLPDGWWFGVAQENSVFPVKLWSVRVCLQGWINQCPWRRRQNCVSQLLIFIRCCQADQQRQWAVDLIVIRGFFSFFPPFFYVQQLKEKKTFSKRTFAKQNRICGMSVFTCASVIQCLLMLQHKRLSTSDRPLADVLLTFFFFLDPIFFQFVKLPVLTHSPALLCERTADWRGWRLTRASSASTASFYSAASQGGVTHTRMKAQSILFLVHELGHSRLANVVICGGRG